MNISKILSRSESEEEQDCNTNSMYESHPSTISQVSEWFLDLNVQQKLNFIQTVSQPLLLIVLCVNHGCVCFIQLG